MTSATLLALLRHAWRRHRTPLIVTSASVGFFEFVLTRLAPSPTEISWIGMLLTTLPPEVRGLIGNDVALSSGGFLALGYAHPFFLLLLSVWVVRVSTAAVASEIGRGTMDLIASRPVPRWQLIASGFVALTTGLGVMIAAAWVGTTVGVHLRGLDVPTAAFQSVALTAWLLFATWGAVGLAIGATRRDASQAISWTTAVIAASFVLDYLARLWTAIGSLRSLSLFRYYEPQTLLAGMSGRAVVVLGVTLMIAYVAATVAIEHRDL